MSPRTDTARGDVSQTFATAAVRLAGLSAWMIGWTPDTFWAATPAELAAILSALTPAHDATAHATPAQLAHLMEQFPDG